MLYFSQIMQTSMQILDFHILIEMVALVTLLLVSKDDSIGFIEETTQHDKNTENVFPEFAEAGPENTKWLLTTFHFCTYHSHKPNKYISYTLIPLSHN